jgi:Mn2+/Fe2+ NRAMP family transporter
LKFLTLVLFAYVAVAFIVDVSPREVMMNTFVPHLSFDREYLLLVVAVLGTTISPYLFFWQASQEVEEMRNNRTHPRLPLKILSRGGRGEFTRMTIDTTAGMVLSNVVAYFIILATASTLHTHGITRIETAAQAAEALRPIAGDAAFLLFALGIVGTGLLAIPVLAGSAAYAVAELFGWPSTLEAKFPEAVGFYVIILAATVIGFAMGFLPINPIRLLVWTAVINGIVAVPIMAMMMLVVTNKGAMGRFQARPSLTWAGWGATALMGVTAAALLWSL